MQDVIELLCKSADHNSAALQAAAEIISRTGANQGILYSAGAGHSLAAVMETFFRAGGLAFVRPIWAKELLPLAGARKSTEAERTVGLGARLVDSLPITANDSVLVFSNSGINPYPVEIALGAQRKGATVIAMTSVQASVGAPRRSDARLFEIANVVIDTLVPLGDVTWPSEHPVTAPASTIVTSFLWADILRRVFDLEPDAPRWQSANTSGNDSLNSELLERFERHVPEL